MKFVSLPGKVSENNMSQNVLVYDRAGVGQLLKSWLCKAPSFNVWSPGVKRSILNRNKPQFSGGCI